MKISTIIPVYNASKFLDKCINSLLQAQIEEVANEIILVDDGSTDNSLQICEMYANSHKNIKVYSQENQGPSVARNLGIEKAIGEYITFVDSDDYVEEDYFLVINKYLFTGANQDIIIFGFNKITQKTSEKNFFPNEILNRQDILKKLQNTSDSMPLFWYPVTKIYKASLIKDLNFNSNINIGEDTIFNIEAMAMSENILIINECLYNYVFNKDSLTSIKFRPNLLSNMEEHYKARIAIHEKFEDLNSQSYYNDISKYYINHILFWILKNIKHSPDSFDKFKELKSTRNSIIYVNCFKYYIYRWNHPKRALLIKLFELKKYNLLLKFI